MSAERPVDGPGAAASELVGLRVLVVDDEPAIRRLLRVALGAQGCVVVEASNAAQGARLAAQETPDLIIVLTVMDTEHEKIAVLDAGADDYVTKPFGMGELAARMRAAVRHARQTSDAPVFRTGDLVLDRARRRVELAGAPILLTPKEYDLLRILADHPGRVLTHRYLLRTVWGPSYEDEAHLLRVHVSNLRRKLEPDPAKPRYIVTEPAVGYRLSDEA